MSVLEYVPEPELVKLLLLGPEMEPVTGRFPAGAGATVAIGRLVAAGVACSSDMVGGMYGIVVPAGAVATTGVVPGVPGGLSAKTVGRARAVSKTNMLSVGPSQAALRILDLDRRT